MEVSIRYQGNVRFEAEARGHRVISDQPVSNGGEDAGLTPPELLVSSLGTCAGYYAVQYLKARSLSAEGLEIHVTADKALQPARLAQFRIEVSVPGLDAAHEAGILRAVKSCLIHHTLLQPPAIETVFKAVATVG
ncbi:MAG: OsmC family protein [Bryobacteraceae bacterium]